jgi:hypothetical protein
MKHHGCFIIIFFVRMDFGGVEKKENKYEWKDAG